MNENLTLADESRQYGSSVNKMTQSDLPQTVKDPDLEALHWTFVQASSDQFFKRYPLTTDIRDLNRISVSDRDSICLFSLSIARGIEQVWRQAYPDAVQGGIDKSGKSNLSAVGFNQ
jgi:hypothetical protein